MVSAVATSVVSLPFDNIKTKLQKQKAVNGVFPYKGMPDCFAKTLAKEGATGFWAGLPTYYFRVGPHSVITLLAAEQFRTMLGVGKAWKLNNIGSVKKKQVLQINSRITDSTSILT